MPETIAVIFTPSTKLWFTYPQPPDGEAQAGQQLTLEFLVALRVRERFIIPVLERPADDRPGPRIDDPDLGCEQLTIVGEPLLDVIRALFTGENFHSQVRAKRIERRLRIESRQLLSEHH